MAVNPKGLRDRVNEADMIDWRNFRISSTQNWKNRMTTVDKLYRGDWDEVFPDESIMRENPHVMNMVQVGLDDVAKLVSEATPSVRCLPAKDTHASEEETVVRNSIADTYWEVNNGEVLIPQLAMDLAGAGAAVVVGYVDENSDYPCLLRIDPRYAYPDVVNGEVIDLLVVEEMNVRTAAYLFPELGIDGNPMINNTKVEVVHYYSKEECVQAVMWAEGPSNNQDARVVKRWKPKQLTVALAKLDAYDGQFRGMFDQITGSLQTKNRIVKQILDFTDRIVYSEIVSKGLLNPEAADAPGPNTHYRLDTNVPDSMVGHVPPAGSAPQVFQLLEYLDTQERGAAGYPASRQGEVSQSIASAAFTASTQGQLTSTVRNIQRLLSVLRQRLNEIMFKLDEDFLDFEKPLYYPVGKKRSYTPSKAIAGNYKNMVLYGAGAGISRQEADVRVMQLVTAHIISLQEAREQIDFIKNPDSTSAKVDFEQTQSAVMQKFLGEGSLEQMMQALAMQAEGKSFATAVIEISKKALEDQQAQAAAAAQAQQAGGQPGQEGLPQDAAVQQLALSKGGMPGPGQPTAPTPGGGPPVQPEFAPPPFEQISVA